MKHRLTDRTIKSLKRASTGKRYDVTDVEARGLAVRVNDVGRKTFVLITYLAGKRTATRLTLGDYPSMTLSEARARAREWRDQVKEGKDPRVERERRRQAEMIRQADTFAAIAERYFADIHRRGLRRADEVERDVRREFVARWGKRAITDITGADVLAVIDHTVGRGAFWQAHHLLSYVTRLFNWAIERRIIERSPCDRMRPAKLIGPKEPRTRILTDIELRTLWHISPQLGYPMGPLVRMLMLTGQRRSECAGMRWREIDRDLWTIPHARMKAKAAHVVPLTDDVIALLDDVPHFDRGDYVFSTTFGAKAVNGFSKAKVRIDAVMTAELGHEAPPWVIHDVRRTMRTHLSALPVPDLVRELVIGHTKQGLHKVCDQHAYLDEKRHALELWQQRLRSIVDPPPDNVVPMRA